MGTLGARVLGRKNQLFTSMISYLHMQVAGERQQVKVSLESD